jgi:hypothetical protein
MQRTRHVPAGQPEMLTVHLRGGRIVNVEVQPVRRLTTREAVQAKFRLCAKSVLAPRSIAAVEAEIFALEERGDIAALMQAAGGF